jgi:hypothetical protein
MLRAMNASRLRLLASLLLVGLVGLAGCPAPASEPTLTHTTPPGDPTPTPTQAGARDETFTGTITAINFGCAVDASCDVTIDNTKTVHFGHDTRRSGPTTWGNTEELWGLMQTPDQGVGKKVEVFAATTDGSAYTLEGKKDYYVRVTP